MYNNISYMHLHIATSYIYTEENGNYELSMIAELFTNKNQMGLFAI